MYRIQITLEMEDSDFNGGRYYDSDNEEENVYDKDNHHGNHNKHH